jgi:hypothetical protein
MTLTATNDDEKTVADFQTSVLAVGPWDRSEFAWLQAKLNGSSGWLRRANCANAASLIDENGWTPEFMLIAQPLPGGVGQEEIEQLRRAAPLAQIVIVAGSWCEGELRTGHPPEGALRMYWHEFANWWLERGTPTSLDGPLASRSSKLMIADQKLGSVAIFTRSVASFETLASIFTLSQSDAQWVRKTEAIPEGANNGIWDGGQLDAAELSELQIAAAEFRRRGGRLIVLLDYPRKQHIELLKQLGCHAVLGKPYVIEELIAACTS